MNQEEIKKKQKRVMIYILIVSLICVVGVSYAFFTAGMSSETSTTVRADAGTMKITYNGGTNINLSGIYPKDDVWATKTITVTGNNTTDAEMYYKLTLVVDSNTFKADDPLQYELVSTNTSTNGEIIPNISKTDITGTSIELGSGKFKKANNASHTYLLKIYYPKKTTSQNANQGAAFSAHVEITPVNINSSVINAPKGWNEAKDGTLLASLRNTNKISEPLTIPGAEPNAYTLDDENNSITQSLYSDDADYYITYGTGWKANGTKFNLTGTSVTSDTYKNSYSSLVGKYITNYWFGKAGSKTAGEKVKTTDLNAIYYVESATATGFTYKALSSNKNTTEALLASTEDDYGTSYYYRGNVKNNYVEFANKCWRIVRVAGDGSVKIVLHNDNTVGAANPCSSANNSSNAAYAKYSGTTYTSAFNTNRGDNAYVGFMYGTAGANTYADTHANTNKSTILINLETWYTNDLKTSADKIADTVWCNDKSIVTDTSFDPDNITPTGLGYGANATYYASSQRLESKNGDAGGTGPSLKCNGELSKITLKIGLLSADEIAFAGYASILPNPTSYLQENATDSFWWSLSPVNFGYNDANFRVVYGENGLFGYYYGDGTGGVRPSISLVSSTTISGGSGTSEDPYVIN